LPKNRRFWIGLGITLLFLFLFIFEVRDDIGEMGQALGEANYLFLIPGILIYYLGVLFRAVRWRYLLKPLGSYFLHRETLGPYWVTEGIVYFPRSTP